jgi:hypothetical protein
MNNMVKLQAKRPHISYSHRKLPFENDLNFKDPSLRTSIAK